MLWCTIVVVGGVGVFLVLPVSSTCYAEYDWEGWDEEHEEKW